VRSGAHACGSELRTSLGHYELETHDAQLNMSEDCHDSNNPGGESDNWPIPEQPGESCYDWQPPAPPTLHLNDKDLIWLKSIHVTEKK